MSTASKYVNPNATLKNTTEMNNYRSVLEAAPPSGMKPCQSAIVVPIGDVGRHRVGITDEAGNLHVMAHEEDVADLDTSKLEAVLVDDVTIEGDGATTALSVKNESITAFKLADDAVVTDKIADSAVITAKIANASVSIAKIEKIGSITGTIKEGNDSRTLRDLDGNVYRTVKIDGVEWMAENLKVTRYRDGASIPQEQDGTAWAALTTGALCGYDNDAENVNIYGYLYNWFVVDPANTRKVAPKGWRVPDVAAWDTLRDYLIANGYNWDGLLTGNNVGKALASNNGSYMEHATPGRVGNAQNSNNASGFTALPSGFRMHTNGLFTNIGMDFIFWCSTLAGGDAYTGSVRWNDAGTFSYSSNKASGFSIRLVRGGRNTAGVGGPDALGAVTVLTEGFDTVSIAPTTGGTDNYYDLEDGYETQEITVLNAGSVLAYVNFGSISNGEARKAIWLDGAWRVY